METHRELQEIRKNYGNTWATIGYRTNYGNLWETIGTIMETYGK
jgi:hypothetical protein